MAVSSPVAHSILIISSHLRKIRYVSSPLSVIAVVESVSCDGAGFAKVPAISEGRWHDSDDSHASACGPASFVV